MCPILNESSVQNSHTTSESLELPK